MRLLASQVMLFYVQQRPGGVDVAKQLLQAGIIRSVAALLPKARPSTTTAASTSPSSAEPLRLLVLLCSASSADVRQWLLAVPRVRAWLQGAEELKAGGTAECHGAIWRLLASSGAGVFPSEEQHQNSDSIMAMLQLPKGEDCDMRRLRILLRLMLDVHQVSDGRFHWGTEITDRLKSLPEELRSRYAACITFATGGGSISGGAEGRADCDSSDDDELGRGAAGAEDATSTGHAACITSSRAKGQRSKQLVSECLLLIKSLVVSGGKTD